MNDAPTDDDGSLATIGYHGALSRMLRLRVGVRGESPALSLPFPTQPNTPDRG